MPKAITIGRDPDFDERRMLREGMEVEYRTFKDNSWEPAKVLGLQAFCPASDQDIEVEEIGEFSPGDSIDAAIVHVELSRSGAHHWGYWHQVRIP